MLRLILYPGVIIHEFSHVFACLFLGAKISKVSFGINESYVKHDKVTPVKMALISLAPFYIGLLVSILFLFLVNRSAFVVWWIFLIINYLIFATLFYSIQSEQDMKNITSTMSEQTKKEWKKGGFWALVVIIKVCTIYLVLYILAQIVLLFDRFEALRSLYVFLVFIAVYAWLLI